MRVGLLLLLCICCSFAQKSVDQAARDASCSTTAVLSLSTQLIQEMNCINSGLMTSFAGNSKITYSASTFPYLQTPAREALVKAVTASGRTLSVNSALRTLAQQYLLYRWNQLGLCGITAAASPGNSNHNGGLAIDINDYATWRQYLEPYGWKWFGNGDKPHYTYVQTGTKDVRSVSVLAFQRLWNRNNPTDRISEDGQWGPGTELRLQRSPTTGFPIGVNCNSPTTPTNSTPSAPVSCTVSGKVGSCLDTTLCTGTSTPGYCPGAANIQCCTSNTFSISSSSCNTANGAGECQDVATCSGTSYPGYCPGANNIQCCIAGSPPSGGLQTTNQAGIDLIKSFEGYYANFYIDPVGIKTIGYGHACHVSDCSNLQAKSTSGNFYKVNAPLTRVAAEDLLRADLEKGGYESCVRKAVTRTITDNQFGSLVSFVFNLGCGALTKSTLLTRVNANAAQTGIRAAFVMWNKAGGKVLAGLTRRRNAEADLYAGKTITAASSNKRYPQDGVGEECWFQGEKGVCLYTSNCTGFNVAGLCPGPNDVKCCLRNKCTAGSGTAGSCVLNTMCGSGLDSDDSLCQGATDLQCCTGTVNERTMICPDGTSWDKTNKWCSDDTYAYGPFTTFMLNQCMNIHGDSGLCTDRIAVMTGGVAVGVTRWNLDFALQMRGTADCPAGSLANSNFQGLCVETSGNLSIGATQVSIIGSIDTDVQDACSNLDGGNACVTSRWSGDFFRSLAVPFRDSVMLDDEAGVPPADSSSNQWIGEQQKYSDAVNADGLPSDAGVIVPFLALSAAIVAYLL